MLLGKYMFILSVLRKIGGIKSSAVACYCTTNLTFKVNYVNDVTVTAIYKYM